MADCNSLFIAFNQEIRLTDQRRIILRERRDDLRRRINSGYSIVKASERYQHEIQFQSQGSYVMDTIINPEDKSCEYDLDDGLYFIGNLTQDERPVPKTFHDWVIASIKQGKSDRGYEDITDKQTCVRVKYKGQENDLNYHIDIPIYYAQSINSPDLAHLRDNWILSNPIAFIIWFENLTQSGFRQEYLLEHDRYYDEYHNWLNDIRKNDHQLRRIVRYLKAWGDHIDDDMPPGIVMTILAGKNYVMDVRDDISLKNTLEKIQQFLNGNNFKCPRPTSPEGEDLFKHYTDEQKKFFQNKLDAFVVTARQAIKMENQKDACRKWKEHLGRRFPCNLAINDIEGSDVHERPVLIKSSREKSA